MLSAEEELFQLARRGRLAAVRAENQSKGTVLATRVILSTALPDRVRGLLGRPALEPGEGLWIVPCSGVHTVGMTYPIDVLHLDKWQHVVLALHAVPPNWHPPAGTCRTAVRARTYTVLELPAGTLAQSNTEVGDQIAVR